MTASPHVGRNVDVNWHLPYLIRHWVGTKEKARLGQWDFTKKEVIFRYSFSNVAMRPKFL